MAERFNSIDDRIMASGGHGITPESIKIIAEGFALISRGLLAFAKDITSVARPIDCPCDATNDTRTCTLPEAAKRLNLSRSTISRLCETGELKCIKSARSGYRRVVVSSISEYYQRYLQTG